MKHRKMKHQLPENETQFYRKMRHDLPENETRFGHRLPENETHFGGVSHRKHWRIRRAYLCTVLTNYNKAVVVENGSV